MLCFCTLDFLMSSLMIWAQCLSHQDGGVCLRQICLYQSTQDLRVIILLGMGEQYHHSLGRIHFNILEEIHYSMLCWRLLQRQWTIPPNQRVSFLILLVLAGYYNIYANRKPPIAKKWKIVAIEISGKETAANVNMTNMTWLAVQLMAVKCHCIFVITCNAECLNWEMARNYIKWICFVIYSH